MVFIERQMWLWPLKKFPKNKNWIYRPPNMSDNHRELYGINSRPRRSKNFKVAGVYEFPLLGITPKQCGIKTTRNTLRYFKFWFSPQKLWKKSFKFKSIFLTQFQSWNSIHFCCCQLWNFDEWTFYEKIIIFLFQMN